LVDEAALNAVIQKFEEKQLSITQEIESMAPNMRAVERLDEVKERLRVNNDDYMVSVEVCLSYH
jgi:hypothetical protein